MSQTRVRDSISLEVKHQIIQLIDTKSMEIKDIVVKFGLKAKQNVARIWANREKIKLDYEKKTNKNAKKCLYVGKSRFPKLEQALVIWMKGCRDNKIPLATSLIAKQAKDLADLMKLEDFKGSDGFVKGVIKRSGMSFVAERGDSEGVCETTVNSWKSKLEDIIKDREAKDVFNIDETGVYWRLLPNKTFAFNNESGKGTQKAKDRLTVVLIANADGTEKYIHVIGKSKKPRCFKNVKVLPVHYHQQNNAWINGDIWIEILRSLDKKVKREVILFADNCGPHVTNGLNLKNIKLLFFPSNTSVLQPLDQGIIHSFKSNYKKCLISFLIKEIKQRNLNEINKKVRAKDIDVLTALTLMKLSWEDVTSKTITNCFRKAFFYFTRTTITIADENQDEDENSVWKLLEEVNQDQLPFTSLKSYLDFDDNVECFGQLSNEEIVEIVNQ